MGVFARTRRTRARSKGAASRQEADEHGCPSLPGRDPPGADCDWDVLQVSAARGSAAASCTVGESTAGES